MKIQGKQRLFHRNRTVVTVTEWWRYQSRPGTFCDPSGTRHSSVVLVCTSVGTELTYRWTHFRSCTLVGILLVISPEIYINLVLIAIFICDPGRVIFSISLRKFTKWSKVHEIKVSDYRRYWAMVFVPSIFCLKSWERRTRKGNDGGKIILLKVEHEMCDERKRLLLIPWKCFRENSSLSPIFIFFTRYMLIRFNVMNSFLLTYSSALFHFFQVRKAWTTIEMQLHLNSFCVSERKEGRKERGGDSVRKYVRSGREEKKEGR